MVLGFILYEAVDLLWNFGGMTYRGSKTVYNWYYDIPTPDDIEINELKKLNDRIAHLEKLIQNNHITALDDHEKIS
tara:strand:- start:1689 stop:1916 length:228 start_codon:yes stop_codon:yes gene_type:complete